MIAKEIGDPYSPLHGRSQDELMAGLQPRNGPERILDFMLQDAGPYGDGFGSRPRRPHPRRARGQPARHRPRAGAPAAACLEALAHRDRQDRARAPQPICVHDVARLRARARPPDRRGRRPLRAGRPPPAALRTTPGCTTSSSLVKGKDRCTAHGPSWTTPAALRLARRRAVTYRLAVHPGAIVLARRGSPTPAVPARS